MQQGTNTLSRQNECHIIVKQSIALIKANERVQCFLGSSMYSKISNITACLSKNNLLLVCFSGAEKMSMQSRHQLTCSSHRIYNDVSWKKKRHSFLNLCWHNFVSALYLFFSLKGDNFFGILNCSLKRAFSFLARLSAYCSWVQYHMSDWVWISIIAKKMNWGQTNRSLPLNHSLRLLIFSGKKQDTESFFSNNKTTSAAQKIIF